MEWTRRRITNIRRKDKEGGSWTRQIGERSQLSWRSTIIPSIGSIQVSLDDSDDSDQRPHHEEGSASQQRFRRHTKDLVEVLLSNGNPFEESSRDLVTLDNKVCKYQAAAASVIQVELLGQEQYKDYKNDAAITRHPSDSPDQAEQLKIVKLEATMQENRS